MTTSNVAYPISAEEIAVALDGIGADASLDRVREVAALIDPARIIEGNRAEVVAAEVETAWRGLQDLAGKQARTMDEGKALLGDALQILGASRSEWEQRGEFVSPWEFCEVKFADAATGIPVGVSAGGVVSVDRDPFTPGDRRLNVEIEPLVTSLSAARESHLQYEAVPTPAVSGGQRVKRPAVFRPTEAMINAAERVVLAEAVLKVIAPVVDQYERSILAEGQWRIRSDFRDEGLADEVIADPKRSYLMADEDFAVFHERCKEARSRASLWVADPEQCPKLVAENDLRLAKHALIDSMEPVTHAKAVDIFALPLEKSERFVELTQNLLARHVDGARVKAKFAAWRAEREPLASAAPELGC
jgi:hypothetical protein